MKKERNAHNLNKWLLNNLDRTDISYDESIINELKDIVKEGERLGLNKPPSFWQDLKMFFIGPSAQELDTFIFRCELLFREMQITNLIKRTD